MATGSAVLWPGGSRSVSAVAPGLSEVELALLPGERRLGNRGMREGMVLLPSYPPLGCKVGLHPKPSTAAAFAKALGPAFHLELQPGPVPVFAPILPPLQVPTHPPSHVPVCDLQMS